VFKTIRFDLKRLLKSDEQMEKFRLIGRVITDPGIQILINFRFQDFLYKNHVPIFPWLIFLFNRLIYGCEILPGASIGHGFRIFHGTGVVIGGGAVIGNNVTLYQNVTLGSSLTNRDGGYPVIENDVLICANSVLVGDITVHQGAVVGACSFVNKSIPKDCVAYGFPLQIKRKKKN
jgi:serine O-acetyltransferase